VKKIKIVFLLIIFLAGFLRFYRLGQIPPSLEWDEVAIGYDAYSVLKTGRDQFGQFLPLTFRSIDDYKPPLYEYLAIPPIAIFGLNEFSVRFPSAFFGTLAVVLTFFLVKEILTETGGKTSKTVCAIALLSALFLAISAWHLQFSRAAFEVNLSVTLLISAVLCFLVGMRNSKYFVISCLLFGLGFFTYHSARVIFPIIFIFLLVNFRKSLPNRKFFLIGLAVYTFFIILFAPMIFSSEIQMRLRVTNISNLFTQKATIDKMQNNLKIDGQNERNPGYRFFHGQKTVLITTAVDNYFSHFNYDFLFVKADVPLHHAPDFGLLYRFDLPFLVIGVFIFLSKFLNRRNSILLIWFLFAPLPAAITLQAPHAVRSELFLPTFQIFAAIGFVSIANLILQKSRIIFWIFLATSSLFLFFNFALYLHQYYVHLPYEYAKNWLYGRKEAVTLSEQLKNKYPKVIISTKLEMAYLFWLFYTKYDPKLYQEKGGTLSGGWGEQGNKFDKYEFHLPNTPQKEKALYITLPGEIYFNGTPVREIKYPNGEVAILLWD